MCFGKYGFLKERVATSYPGFEKELIGAEYVKEDVVVSDFVITSRGLGTAIPFALTLIGLFLISDSTQGMGLFGLSIFS